MIFRKSRRYETIAIYGYSIKIILQFYIQYLAIIYACYKDSNFKMFKQTKEYNME